MRSATNSSIQSRTSTYSFSFSGTGMKSALTIHFQLPHLLGNLLNLLPNHIIHHISVAIHPQLQWPYIPAGPAEYWGLVVYVIPGDDILQACSHGGTNGENKALFKGPAQHAQHSVTLRAVGEVGNTVCSGVPNTWVGVFWLLATKLWNHIKDFKATMLVFETC